MACGASWFADGLITLRLRGLYLGLTTWFVAEALRSTISNTPGYTRGMLGLAVDPFPTVLGIDFARGQLLNYYYLPDRARRADHAGHAVPGALQDWARVPGDPRGPAGDREPRTERHEVQADQLHRGLLPHRGARRFYAHYLGILSPTPEEFGVPRTVEILTVCYVGGRGTLWGSLFAGFS